MGRFTPTSLGGESDRGCCHVGGKLAAVLKGCDAGGRAGGRGARDEGAVFVGDRHAPLGTADLQRDLFARGWCVCVRERGAVK